jgi:hypothetical protein
MAEAQQQASGAATTQTDKVTPSMLHSSYAAPSVASEPAETELFPLMALPRDLLRRVASCLRPNEVATGLRLTCKQARELLANFTVVQLSQPVPEEAFAARFGGNDALSSYTLPERLSLVKLTAASGSLPNVRLLVCDSPTCDASHSSSLTDPDPSDPPDRGGIAGCALRVEVLIAAAGAGHLPICRLLRELSCPWSISVAEAAASGGHEAVLTWLHDAGCPWGPRVVEAAASAGHGDLVCQLLLGKRCEWSAGAAAAAARGGHVALAAWLLLFSQQHSEWRVEGLLRAAAFGYFLADFQAWRMMAHDAWRRGGSTLRPVCRCVLRSLCVAASCARWAAGREPEACESDGAARATCAALPMFAALAIRMQALAGRLGWRLVQGSAESEAEGSQLLQEAAISPTDYRAKVRRGPCSGASSHAARLRKDLGAATQLRIYD